MCAQALSRQRSSSVPTYSDAYIRVRVPNAPRPDGSTLVYLPNGTGFVVNSRHLLRISPDDNASPEQPTMLEGRTP